MADTGRSHDLKTWPEFFQAVLDGKKRFEIRRDDRGFMEGDTLVLKEWDPGLNPGLSGDLNYTGRKIRVRVTYKLHGGMFGVDLEYCVLGFEYIDTSN